MRAMKRHGQELKIDRAIYAVDETTKTYRYLRRNPTWKRLHAEENERNKRHIDGYERIFRDGKRILFHYEPPYTMTH